MRHLLLVALFAATILIGLACGRQDPGLVAPDGLTESADKTAAVDPTPPSDPIDGDPQMIHNDELHDFLGSHFHSDSDYVRFSAWIDPQQGGVVRGEMVDWYPGCHFEINIQPYAIPDTERVLIAMDIPIYDHDADPADGPPAVIRFHPHGLHFNIPIDLVICFPWWQPVHDKIFRLYYIDDTHSQHQEHYEFGLGHEYVVGNDHQPTGNGFGVLTGTSIVPESVVPLPPYFDTWSAYLAVCTGLRFQIDHFSRWETVTSDGDGGDGGDGDKFGWPWDDGSGNCEPREMPRPEESSTLPR